MILDDRWMLSILTDLSGLDRQQRETARQRLYFKTILENLTDGVMQIDQGDRIAACNRRLFEMFDVDPAAFAPGMDVEDFARLHGDLLGIAPADREAEITNRANFARGRHCAHTTFSMMRQLRSGVILNVTRTPLPGGGAVITASDVTESHQLARQREMFKTVIETIDEGVTLVEPDHTLGVVNEQMLRLYDIDPAEAHLGRHVSEIAAASGDVKGLPADAAERKVEDLVRFATEPAPGEHRSRHQLQDGRTVEVHRTVLEDGSAVATHRDITQETQTRDLLQQAAEAAEQANRLKSDFIGKVTHELRTPMHGVLGMAALLARSNLDDTQRRTLDMLTRSGRHMVELIDGLMTISTLETGDLELLEETVELDAIAMHSIEMIRPRAIDKGLDIRLDKDFDGGICVLGDGTRLTQIMVNLLSNAVKFTENGYVRLMISTEPAGDAVRLTARVEDTGPGIPEDKQQTIFEKFSQLNETSQPVREGVGLGLSIVRALTDLMGGTLTVESDLGRGSVFTLAVVLPGVAGAARTLDG